MRKLIVGISTHYNLLLPLVTFISKKVLKRYFFAYKCDLWKWLKIREIEVCWSCQNRSTIWKIKVRFLDQNWHFTFVKNQSTIW